MYFDIPIKDDFIRKYCRLSPEISQSETAKDEKNDFLNLSEFCGISVCVLTQLN